MSTLTETRRDLLDAAEAYEWASDHNGADVLAAGARLRILAKRYAKAKREAAGVTEPASPGLQGEWAVRSPAPRTEASGLPPAPDRPES